MAVNEIRYKGVSYATDDDIKVPSGILYEVKALRSDSLEANSLTVTVFSNDKAIMGFAKNDKVEYFRNGRRVGVYYLQTVERVGSDAYTLSALSALGRLITMRHVGGIYTGQTVAEVVPQICGPVAVMIESVYASRKLYGYLPYSNPDTRTGNGRSARDNLSQVLFAIGASLGTDENGVMRVEKLWDGVSATVTADQINEDTCSTVYETPVSAVEITEHQWVKSQDTVTLFEGTAEDGALVTFEDPAHSLTAEGFTITEQGDNYAILSAGTGILTGKNYNHLTRIVRRTVTEGAEENVVTVSDATLVSLTNSVDVAKRMADYYRHRETIRVDVEPGTERAGRVVQIFHPWDKEMVQACVESRETVISGILNSQTSALVGFTPAQPESAEYFDERVVLTGSGEWEVPAGVTTLKAVLFSGAQGGQAGLKGGTSSGSKTHNHTYTSFITGKVTSQAQAVLWGGPGGAGGAGGPGGKGAKILDVTLSPAAGAKIAYSCGKGSPGAAYNPESTQEAAEGGVTRFGNATSDAGNYSETGWTDPITGEVYGAPGEEGLPGGNGAGAIDGYTIPDNSWDLNEVLKYQPSTPAIDEDGNVWPGATTKEKEDQEQVAYWETFTTNSSGYYGAWAGYALGPGGAAGVTQSEPTIRGSNTTSSATAADGVTGATPTLIPKKAKLTQGGRGGYGGGGGSCAGWAGYEKNPSQTSQSMKATAGKPGEGGNGGTGGEAGDGCIILYYRRPKAVQSGPLVTSAGKWLLDSLGRRIIV